MRPLEGRKVVVTRSREQAADLTQALQNAGATVIHSPVLAFSAPTDPTTLQQIDAALHRIREYDWIMFTSANGVRFFVEHMQRVNIPLSEINAQIVAVGPKTAQALQKYGWVATTPESFYQAEGLLEAIQTELCVGDKVLIPTSNLARDYLREQMSRLGLEVTRIHVYENHLHIEDKEELLQRLQSHEIDCITLMSSSAAQHLFMVLDSFGYENPLQLLEGVHFVCIGPKTAEAIIELGIKEPIVAQYATTESLVARVIELYQK